MDLSRRKKGIDWSVYRHRLGKEADADIARELGCHPSNVTQQRRKLSIPAFNPGTAQPFSVAPSAEPSTLRSYRRPPPPDADEMVSGRAVSEQQWEKIRQWALPEQAQCIDALIACGTVADAALYLGMEPARLRALLSEAERLAARAGWSPSHDLTKTVPSGFHVKGVSTYYDADGQVRGQWVKSAADQEARLSALLDAIQHVVEPLRGKSDIIVSPATFRHDLLSVYPLGDPHVGLLSWFEETGQNFDLEIAEAVMAAVVDELVRLAPPSFEALVVNLGDYFHSDNYENRTKRSGHPLDVDGRWPKVLRVGIRIMRRIIDTALSKHERVKVVNACGNHDDQSAIVLSTCMDSFYQNNPRVEVELSPAAFHYHRFGKNLFGITHGHNVKADKLPGIMACDRKEDWGQTNYRYWLCGHIHHDTATKEVAGAYVETFRTLAARDDWSHRAGYRSGRDLKVLVHHKEYGRTGSHVVGLEQVGFKDSGERNAA